MIWRDDALSAVNSLAEAFERVHDPRDFRLDVFAMRNLFAPALRELLERDRRRSDLLLQARALLVGPPTSMRSREQLRKAIDGEINFDNVMDARTRVRAAGDEGVTLTRQARSAVEPGGDAKKKGRE